MNTIRGLFVVDGVLQRARILVAVVVAALLAAGAVVAWKRTHDLPSDAAFKFGDSVVTTKALDDRIHLLSALYGVKEPTDSAKLATFRRAAAQADAMTLILDKAAADEDIVISDKTARDTLTKMIGDQLGDDPQKSFDALLTKFGVSENDVLAEIKRQQAVALLFRKVTKSASGTPSSADVAGYFKQHAADFAVPDRRHLLNVVVKTRAEANQIAKAAKSADFATLARRYSLDDSTRSKGGDLGTVSASQLDDGYAKVAFAASKGAVFGPVKTSHGWNVGKVLSIVKGHKVTLAKVRSQVVANMRSERALDAWRSWLSKRVADADVQYADDYRPAHPKALPSMTGLPTGTGAAQ